MCFQIFIDEFLNIQYFLLLFAAKSLADLLGSVRKETGRGNLLQTQFWVLISHIVSIN